MNIIYYIISLIWLEVTFHIGIYGKIDKMILFPIIFSVPLSLFLSGLTDLFKEKINICLQIIILFFVSIFFSAQIVYHEVFGTFLVIKSITNGAGQAADFGNTIMTAILGNWLIILCMFMPFIIRIVILILSRKIDKLKYRKLGYRKDLVVLGISIVAVIATKLSLNIYGYAPYSPYEIYYSPNVMEQSMNKLGVVTTAYKDIKQTIYNKLGIKYEYTNKLEVEDITEDITTEVIGSEDSNELEDAITYDPNIIDIDFDSLIKSNDKLSDVHTYFSNVTPTYKNEYTGMFEGYNLIFITAESFSGYLIDKEITPTLYKMYNEGFKFNNFYNPSWYLSTIDGEYVNLLGQIPVDGDWSFQHASENWNTFALGNQLNRLGYNSYAYHNHNAHYYDRTILHPSLGYEFKAVDSGLVMKSKWPESDVELVEITYDEYMDKEPFNAYYITMSGHLPYNYEYNSMCLKHRDEVTDLNYESEDVKAYIAANIEFENSVKLLIEKADEAGVLDNTLFVIVPDHYPYDLKDGAFDELAGSSVEKDKFEIYRSNMLIWSPSMNSSVEVDKYCSSLDILPTISNLMGIEYDSRLLAGRDIMSTSESLVMLKDRSFITDKIKYDAITGDIEYITDEEVSGSYVSRKVIEVNNRFYYSSQILDSDYFNKLHLN